MRPVLRHTVLVVALLVGIQSATALPTARDIQSTFTRLDPDDSKTISLTEWEQASFALFRATDKNDSNALDLSEIQHETLASSTFVYADQNGDKRLDIDEYMRLRRAIFATADLDHGDYLDFVEFELLSLLGFSGWTDANKNHRVEFSELRSSIVRLFNKADLNHDNRLTANEAAFLQPKEFQTIAKDGSVDLETLIARYKQRVTSL